jgi:protein phosphatase
MVGDDRIYEILKGKDIEDKAQVLVNEANANGGKDNIAVVVVEF